MKTILCLSHSSLVHICVDSKPHYLRDKVEGVFSVEPEFQQLTIKITAKKIEK